jgi:preprotein translocase subunit SecE
VRKIIFPSFAELILIGIVVFIFIFGLSNPFYKEISKICILVTISYWAILVLFGCLTPAVRHTVHLSFDVNPKENRLGYPIVVDFQSQGGFICNNPIIVKAKVINTATPQEKGQLYNTVQLFKENFEEFEIIWPNAKLTKHKKSVFLKGHPDIGAVKLDMKKCSGKSIVAFTMPGKQSCRFLYKTKAGVDVTTPLPKEEDMPEVFLYIGPPETLFQIKAFNTIYALLLAILGFWLRNLLIGF